jgi:hypothetical protein
MNQTQMPGSAAGSTYRCDRGSHPRKAVKPSITFPSFSDAMAADSRKGEEGLKLEVMINDLMGKRVITGQQYKQAKVAAHVRTKATLSQPGPG